MKSAFVRQHTATDSFPPHLREVLKTVMGDQGLLIDELSRRPGVTVYVKEHNCSLIGWMAVEDTDESKSAVVVGAGAIQPGRCREDFTRDVASLHRADCLIWGVENPVHVFVKTQLGFKPEHNSDIYIR